MAHRAIENSWDFRICFIYADYELMRGRKIKAFSSRSLRLSSRPLRLNNFSNRKGREDFR